MLTYIEPHELLIREFPELGAPILDDLAKTLDEGEPVPHHIVFSEFFIPLVESALVNQDREIILRAASLIEAIALSDRIEDQELVCYTILEELQGHPLFAASLAPALGPAGVALLRDLEHFFRNVGAAKHRKT